MITIDEIRKQPIKALSWKEPFGSLMLPPHLKVETRSWKTNYRGLVLICTSKQGYRLDKLLEICGDEQFERIMDLMVEKDIKLSSGKAIAIARLYDVQIMRPEHEEFCFVKYQQYLYCHVYTDVTSINQFDWKGSQGFRNVTEEEKQLIKIL